MNDIDGDVILFWLACVLFGVLIAYVVISHVPVYWCGQ